MKKITTFLLSTVFFSKTLASKALHRVVRITLFLIIFSSFSSYAIAGIQEKQDIPKMVQRADLIIRGKVISTESQWKEDSRGRHIYTSVTVKILDKIKGNIKDGAFAFEVVGGTVDDIREVVSDTPAFEVDEDAILFLAGDPLAIQHGINGKIPIYDGRVYLDGSEATADSFIQTLKILEQDPNAPTSLEGKYPAPTEGVEAAECFIYNGQKWFGASPTVYYKINQNTSDCIGEGAAVQRAADTWNNVGADFTFQYDGSHTRTFSSQNYINEIMWGTTSGSVATTYWWHYVTGEIFECDVVFNDPGYSWSSTWPESWQMDVESVALHEFGHWLSLDDLYDPADSDKVMYGYISLGQVERILHPCDCDGICYIYGGGGCGCEGRICEDCEPEDAYLGTIGTVVWDYNVSGNCGNGGKWVGQFVGEAGATYHFDLCPDSPGNGTANFDADIKITNGSCGLIQGAGEDGSCSSPSFLPNDFQWTCTANGTYYVIIAQYDSYDSHTCIGDSGDTFTLEYYKDEGDGCQEEYPSTDVPKTIPDPGITTSTLDIVDTGTIIDLNVKLDITHTYDGDLDVFLIGPDATRVELFTDVGGSGNNFSNTILDDEALVAITSGSAPFDGSYQPEGNLSDFDGKSITGTWILEITDDAGVDSGTLNSWSLIIETVCTLDAPVLHEEPNITPGLCNLISWDTVPEANEYYAECSSDPCFSVVDSNSGWITGTSYEFCGLISGQEYWYRVKSGSPGIESAWSNVVSSRQCGTPGDFEPDCDVDWADLAIFVEQWLLPKLSMDVIPSGGDGFVDFSDWAAFAGDWQDTTDMNDLSVFVDQWLQLSAYCADIAPAPEGDGTVNMLDFAVFAENWLAGVE